MTSFSARFLPLLFLATVLCAEEGMWMPAQLPQLKSRLEALGYKGDPSSFSDLTGFPMGAIVSLGGCSASFVSPEGLIVTNHHCVQGALQYNSRPERNLMAEGYLARAREEELPSGPGSRVFVTVAVEEVTESVFKGIPSELGDAERSEAIEKRIKEITREHESTPGYRCTVASFYEGLKYFAITQLEILDVRLVYAPDKGIGNFGGETDNWRWPRHTGDFSFLRAYVDKEGRPAPYSKENIPYHPKHWLTVSSQGGDPGDLVFVAGYPGRTSRLATYASVRETVEYALPRTIRRNTEQIERLEKLAATDPELALRVSTRIRGLNNSLTKTRGVHEAMVKGGVLGMKESREKRLLAWIAAEPVRQERYGAAVERIAALVAERATTRERDSLLAEFIGGSGSALGAAETLYRFSIEKAKPDAGRDPSYQQRNWRQIREGLDRAQRSLDPRADRSLMAYNLAAISALPAGSRIDKLDSLVGLKPGMPAAEASAAIESFVARMVAGTGLYDKQRRLALLEVGTEELKAAGDTLLSLAAELYPLQESQRKIAKQRSGALSRVAPLYVEALIGMEGGLVAPDANSTLRITYGVVKPLEKSDGIVLKAQTTLRGITEKATGEGEFDAPDEMLGAIDSLRKGRSSPYLDEHLSDVPVDFLSTVDTTGGNSGSATLNVRGELVGLLFDGMYETVASDYFYDAVNTRSIHCDTRFMLWVLKEVDKADNLLAELQVR